MKAEGRCGNDVESGVWSRLASSATLKYEPDARPAGFQKTAEASSATATNAPPIPVARTPTGGSDCAKAAAAGGGGNRRGEKRGRHPGGYPPPRGPPLSHHRGIFT